MRIIAGRAKGRRLEAPSWAGLRPTSDRLRETLFNILQTEVSDARVLDGYAGTGAVGIEAISRGAAHAVFVDDDPRATALIARNVVRCGIDDATTIIRGELPAALEQLPAGPRYDLVLLDPPYEFDAPAIDDILLAVVPYVAPQGRLIVERPRRASTVEVSGLVHLRRVRSGDSALECYVSSF